MTLVICDVSRSCDRRVSSDLEVDSCTTSIVKAKDNQIRTKFGNGDNRPNEPNESDWMVEKEVYVLRCSKTCIRTCIESFYKALRLSRPAPSNPGSARKL